MIRDKKSWATWCFIALMMLFVAVSPTSAHELSGQVLFHETFSDAMVGAAPKGWQVQGSAPHARIVADGELSSGKALHVVANGPAQSTTTLLSPWWNAAEGDPNTVSIEFKINWVSGSSIDMYINGRSGSHISWFIPRNGEILFESETIATLNEGWNTLRLLVHRERNEVYFYVNDLDRPLVGPYPFRTPVTSWSDPESLRFLIRHTRRTDEPTEAFYADFKVSVADDKLFDQIGMIRGSTWVGDKPIREVPEPSLKAASVSNERITLTVTESEGVSRFGQPVTSGIPLPQGHLWKSSEVRLSSPTGEEIPLQTTVLSRWPDGSVRWLLLDFQLDLPASEQSEITLEYGHAVSRSDLSDMVIADDSETVTIDTGSLRMTLGKTAPLIRSVVVDGEHWDGVSDPELVIRGAEALSIGTARSPYGVMVEEAGPNRVVVRVRGELHDRQGSEALNFAYDFRLHFYRDRAMFRIDPTITNLLGQHLFHVKATDITEVSLTFPGWMGENDTTFTMGTLFDDELISGTATPVRLLQFNANQFTLNTVDSELSRRDRARGWVKFQSPDRHIGIGVRHFWEQAPKSIEVNDKGDLIVQLWAPDTGPLTMGGGESKRHELYVSLNAKDQPMISSIVYPLRAVASPKWYSQTEALGRPLFVVQEEQLPLYHPSIATYEAFVKIGYDTIMRNRDLLNEYGWRNFGDWKTTWDVDGWGNGEYDLGYTYFRQFVRTGDVRYLDLAETAIRHWIDIDMVWATNDPDWLGGGHSHSPNHSSYVGDHHTWNQGMVDYYHLTGDRRGLEAARAVGDFFARLALVKPDRNRPRIYPGPLKDVNPRSPGWALIALVTLYESTLDPYYLEAADEVVNILDGWQEDDGQWRYFVSPTEVEGGTLATKPFMSAIVLAALSDYHRVTGDAKAKGMLIKGLDFLADEMWTEDVRGYPYIDHPQHPPQSSIWNFIFLDAYSYGYEITGNPKYMDVAIKGFESAIPSQAGRLGSNVGQRIALTLRNTPHALAALVQPVRDMAVTGPGRVQIDRSQVADVVLTVVRLDDTGSFKGVLMPEDVPQGMRVNPGALSYRLNEGETFVSIPFEIEIDDHVAPGRYTIPFIDPCRCDSGLSLDLQVEVMGWTVSDRFQPPVTDSFFGNLSFQISEEMSSGWEYASDTPEQFFGNAQRLRRSSDSQEYLIYDAPGLFDFALTVYAPVAQVEATSNLVEVWMSTGDQTWEPVPTEVAWEIHSDRSHARGIVTPIDRVFRGDVKLKLAILPSGDPDVPQIGRFEMRGRQ